MHESIKVVLRVHQFFPKVHEKLIDLFARPVKNTVEVAQCERFRTLEIVNEGESTDIFDMITFGPRSTGDLRGKALSVDMPLSKIFEIVHIKRPFH